MRKRNSSSSRFISKDRLSWLVLNFQKKRKKMKKKRSRTRKKLNKRNQASLSMNENAALVATIDSKKMDPHINPAVVK